MAKGFFNERGFKVIEVTYDEWVKATGALQVFCDWCDDCWCADFLGEKAAAEIGKCKFYYIAVLNELYCEKCYNERKHNMDNYIEDAPIENRNYATYAQLLGVEDDLTNN